jgi:hypothetical protein
MAVLTNSSVAEFDEGRFVPGTLLAERYRILGRLGKGGMGEVYAKDPGMLARFYNEVRIARQVTHPNVCRVFDIGDVEGQPFISMQFVDGENLASLLLRIGRLPADKAVEISRRLCAGLAAAHSQGVLHRDLKPANIMIDGRGQVLITDFGLAGLEEEIRGADINSGTPAYMAPEQLAGKEVSSKSDIYALGLVMYEIFTGKRAFEAETLADLIRMRGESRPSEMSSSVRDVDPTVERVILKCLDPDPAKRPSTALAVSAALPGGDPLAAALAAGETPSPEMVAAAGAQEGLKPTIAIACLAAILIALAAVVYFDCRQELAGMVNFELPPEALAVQARKTIQQFGYTGPIADRAFTFDYSGAYLYYLKQNSKQPLNWPKVALSQPPVIFFSYRESPLPLEPHNFDILGRVSADDPPPAISGMVRINLDLTGQLRSFYAVPPQVDTSPPLPQQPDATPLFTAAGLDLKSFQPTDPHWTPLAPVDARAAWTGTYPNVLAQPIRVEAAWWRGKPVYFQIVGPWTQQDRMPAAPRRGSDYSWIVLEGSGGILAVIMAWRNLRLGRGDRHGAIRLAAFAVCIVFAEILLRAHFATVPSTFNLLGEAISQGLWTGGLLWLSYIALEPAVRRLWPRSLITWTRLLSGRWQDALVGRDLLIGLLVGLGYDLVFAADNEYTIRMGGVPSTAPKLDALLGISRAMGVVLDRVQNGLLGAFLFFLVFFLLRAILRKEWLAGAGFVAVFIALRFFSSNNNYPAVDIPAMIIVYGVIVVMLLRCGLLSLVTTIFVTDLIGELVFTTNFSAWYANGSLLLIILLSALAIFAFRKSLGGHRISAALLDQ